MEKQKELCVCSVHGKNRTMQNLMDDGAGGFKCAPGHECGQMTGRNPGGNYGVYTAPVEKQQQWKQSNMQQQWQQQVQQAMPQGGGPISGAGLLAAPATGNVTPAMNMMRMAMKYVGGATAQQIGPSGIDPNNPNLSEAEKEILKLEREMATLQQEIDFGNGAAPSNFGAAPIVTHNPTFGNQFAMGGSQFMGGGRIMKKVRICSYFEKGMCNKGSDCTFAHGEHEIGQPQVGGGGSVVMKPAFTGTTVECSAHGRARTLPNLMDDGAGGMRCAPGFECQVANPGKGSMGGGKGDKGMMPGDWNCPGCGDHQFARNTECRKCGTPNPNPPGAGKGGYSPY